MQNEKTEADSIIALAANLHEVKKIEGTPVIVHGNNYEVTELTHLRESPQRIQTAVVLLSIGSFTDYVEKYRSECSAVFADRTALRIKAVLDYHRRADTPKWGQHVARLSVKLSRQLVEWKGNSKKWMTQAQFAEFIEDHVIDIHEPNGSTMLSIAGQLDVHKKETFRSGVRLQNGDIDLAWKTETNEQGSTKVPSKFVIAVPLFESSEARDVLEATLRYRIEEGKLSFHFHFTLMEDVLDVAWKKLLGELELPPEATLYDATVD